MNYEYDGCDRLYAFSHSVGFVIGIGAIINQSPNIRDAVSRDWLQYARKVVSRQGAESVLYCSTLEGKTHLFPTGHSHS